MSTQPLSRFNPTPETMRQNVAAANDRATRLALRIGAARKALMSGSPTIAVIAILDGKSEPPDPIDAGVPGGPQEETTP